MGASLLRRLWELGPAGVADLALLTGLAALVEVGIRTRPLAVVARRCGVRLSGEPTPASSWRLGPRHSRRRRIVDMILRHWPVGDRDGMCLRRSLLVGWVLRARDPLLRLGIARVDGAISAHAWLELEGGQLGRDGIHTTLDLPH